MYARTPLSFSFTSIISCTPLSFFYQHHSRPIYRPQEALLIEISSDPFLMVRGEVQAAPPYLRRGVLHDSETVPDESFPDG